MLLALPLDTNVGSIEPLEKPGELELALDDSTEDPDEVDDVIGVDDPELEAEELRDTLGKPSPVG